jgi:putative DNA primase/helicase
MDARGKKYLVPESIAADLLTEELKGKVSYCVESQQWHLFNETYWEGDMEADAVDPMLVKLMSEATATVGYSYRFFQAVKSMLRSSGKLRLKRQDFNTLPFMNGILNIKTGIMMDITPDNAHTWSLPYKYDIRADCPNTKKWVSGIVDGDKDMIEYVRAWMNAIITGRSDLQRFLHVVGSGRTGKSTFQRLLSVILGSKNTVTTSLAQLEVNRFETSALVNKRLVIIADSDKYGKSVNTLKAITGQDPIRIERKNVSRMQDYVFEGMVLMASNEHIVSTDHTSGLDRRRAIIGFNNHISDEQLLDWDRKGGEAKVLYSEAPGIINWVLELSHEDVTRIIKDPPVQSAELIMEAIEHSNPVAEWLRERVMVEKHAWTQIGMLDKVNVDGITKYANVYSQLYPNYCDYCDKTGKSSMSCARFKATLMDCLKTFKVNHEAVRKNKGNGIAGIRLLTPEELGLDPQRGLDNFEY